jgi:hypothetical protein
MKRIDVREWIVTGAMGFAVGVLAWLSLHPFVERVYGQAATFASIGPTGAQQHILPAVASDTFVLLAAAQTLTNKTLDAEATGNVVTAPWRIFVRAASCNNVTATTDWDLPTTNAAVPACNTGTNTQKGTLDFADGANRIAAQYSLVLPADFVGTFDTRWKWFDGTATTGAVKWDVQTICVADAETSDPAFNTASTVTDTAKATINQDNDAAITGVTITGCAANELLYVNFSRDANNAADTMTDTARLRAVEFTFRRAM